MKKITSCILTIVLCICISSCTGYKPIFATSNLQFEIANFSIEGDKKLGNKIYYKLNNLSKLNKKPEGTTGINIIINVSKKKEATIKDTAGKILEYKVNLNTKIIVENYLTEDEILNKNFISSSSYKVQDQYSETLKGENQLIENLIDQTYQELLINLSESISK